MNPEASDKKNLLLVDDDRLVLVTISQGLVNAGYTVSTAESVDEAEAILASGERPDLVILDVRMPGRKGLDLAERLRSFDHIPFMFLSAYSDADFVEQASQSGALSYLIKPIDTPQLLPAVGAALARADELKSLRNTERQLQSALDNERGISIAIGITMMQYRVSRREAFELLRKTARNQRRKLADLAAEVITASESLNLGK